ncbi:MAG: aminoacyl-histidine dipeptidase [Planctomycetes bacterium]|nr:aminoacyl-histidine dipeptidase [Planctomycetota bacterium]
MSDAMEGLKPGILWKYFAEIARIPRCSKSEAAISKYVHDVAKRLGLPAKVDRFGNVVVKKPASPGREGTRGIALQGHLDMVCEKNEETVHDFSKDPIEIVRRGNVLMADGTTLGADNGIGVATMLAIMEDARLEHGPLEFLFTVDEETGLTGAGNLAPGLLEARTLINLDSEEYGTLYVGCAGGRDTVGRWKLVCEDAPPEAVPARVTVKGLRGGHSGIEIDKGRGNAIKILNRVLLVLDARGARLASIEGGNKHNAIPREAQATVFVPADAWDAAAAAVAEFVPVLEAEIAAIEPDLDIAVERDPDSLGGKVLKKALQKKLLRAISALPHGVIKMSAEISWLVETSTNVATIKTTPKAIELGTSQRSSVASEIAEICQTVESIFALAGARPLPVGGYPGWKPNLDSPILKVAKEAYAELHGEEPEVKAVHAGLECGIIGEKFPGMDMVSLGPTLEGVHSPDEKIHIDSVEKYWTYLLAILRRAG